MKIQSFAKIVIAAFGLALDVTATMSQQADALAWYISSTSQVSLKKLEKEAVASLWNISNEGTLALMTEFYQQLRIAPIKAEALR